MTSEFRCKYLRRYEQSPPAASRLSMSTESSIFETLCAEVEAVLPPGPAGEASPSHCSEVQAASRWETPPAWWSPPGGGPWNPGRWLTRQRGQSPRGQTPSRSLSLHPGLPLEQREVRDYCTSTQDIYYDPNVLTVSFRWWRPSESGEGERSAKKEDSGKSTPSAVWGAGS